MSITIGDLKTQILERCNLENSNFITTSECLSLINSSLAELYDILASKYGEDYFASELTFALDGTTDGYSLPADFKSFLDLDFQEGNRWRRIDRTTRAERDLYDSLPPSGTYRLAYVPRYVNRTSLDDTLDDLTLQNWHEYAIVDCCIKVLTKEETDAQVFIMQKQQLLDRITKHSAHRDNGQPFRLTDTGCYDHTYHTLDPVNSRLRYRLQHNMVKIFSVGFR